MIKIAIITKYYNSANYGGLLQAYALTHYLQSIGYDAFQICFDEKSVKSKSVTSDLSGRFSSLTFIEKVKRILKRIKTKISVYATRLFLKNKNKLRRQAFTSFRESIPHTSTVYNSNTISDVNPKADIFITGSDRVWSERSIGDEYYLSFVKSAKKIAYAVSLRANELNKNQKEAMAAAVEKIDAVSVREKETVRILSEITNKKIEHVLDPTFLLDKTEWAEIAGKDPFECESQYIFCYFLGDDIKNRRLVKQFAKNKKLKIITLPYSKESFNLADVSFGDIRLTQVSPNRFLYLIKNASYVFTDSFHASVFSIIFHRQFFIMPRNEIKGSGTRIESLVSVAGIENRYCENTDKYTLLSLDDIDYNAVDGRIQQYRESSVAFLNNAVNQ